MKWNIGDPVTQYTDECGCVWKDGQRIHVCPRHRHKNGIRPNTGFPRFKL